MRRRLYRIIFAAAALLVSAAQAPAQGWELIWSDEFRGARRGRGRDEMDGGDGRHGLGQ